jgi:flagellar protein FliS
MSINETNAAGELKSSTNVSPHKLISLLMSGALERVEQTRQSISAGNKDEEAVLMEKLVAIINGLRDSLNFEEGGEIAINLDGLYEYMILILGNATNQDAKTSALSEVEALMSEVKLGWDGVEEVIAA